MKKRYFWPAFASFFVVGLGQVIKGEGTKGLLLVLAFYFAIPGLIYLTLMINAYLFLTTLGAGIICGAVLWFNNLFDAWTHETLG
jgi:hypothetical protein